jgi:hypothetical protein
MQRWFRRTGGEVLGWVLVAGGLALIPLPGPGMIVLVAGVALLAPHYEWAQRILDPLRKRAVEGAKQSVSTPLRVLGSLAGVLWLLGLGVLWLLSPTFPPFTIAGWMVGPKLPGGHAAGIGLVTSGAVAALLLAYSVKRWYPGFGRADR